jgi:type IV secretory pathway TraG/TraD family ATPase VirD4
MIIFGMDQNRRDIIGPILATVLHMVVTRNYSAPHSYRKALKT